MLPPLLLVGQGLPAETEDLDRQLLQLLPRRQRRQRRRQDLPVELVTGRPCPVVERALRRGSVRPTSPRLISMLVGHTATQMPPPFPPTAAAWVVQIAATAVRERGARATTVRLLWPEEELMRVRVDLRRRLPVLRPQPTAMSNCPGPISTSAV